MLVCGMRTKKQIENLGAVAVDYTLNRAGLNPFKDLLDTY